MKNLAVIIGGLISVVTATTLLTPGIARADWVYITSSSDGNSQLFIDDSSIVRRGNIVDYWQQAVNRVPYNGVMKVGKTHSSVNCQTRNFRVSRMVTYDSAGKQISDRNVNEKDYPPQEIVPGTVLDDIYKTLCSN